MDVRYSTCIFWCGWFFGSVFAYAVTEHWPSAALSALALAAVLAITGYLKVRSK